MEIIIGILAVIVVVQEWRIHKLYGRMMFQANVPQYLGPVRTTAPVAVSTTIPDPPEKIETRRKIATVKIPE
jgi:hypothetical protein